MQVDQALQTRKSIRAYKPDPVSEDTLKQILQLASRAPSGGNLQPWKVYVLTGASLQRLISRVKSEQEQGRFGEGSEYDIYPPNLIEPYRTRRYAIGEAMYQKLDIAREDKMGRLANLARNFSFFDAPVGLFFSFDRSMGVGQHADLGMFMQSIMLLARQYGLDTCAQEAWAMWYKTVADVVNMPDNEMLFCGMALGYADTDAVVNSVDSERAALDDFVQFVTE